MSPRIRVAERGLHRVLAGALAHALACGERRLGHLDLVGAADRAERDHGLAIGQQADARGGAA